MIAAASAAFEGQLDILKYLVKERKISDEVKVICMEQSAEGGHLDCLNYLVEEEKVPLHKWTYIAGARYYEHPACVNYLREKGCPELTDEQYTYISERYKEYSKQSER